MPPPPLIRAERAADAAAIAEITQEAFQTSPHSSHNEHFIIDALRRENALSISLVAEVESRVVAQIAFSPVSITDGSQDWYGLGPLSVRPPFQGRGIGQELVQEGLAALRTLDAAGCVVVGEPGYYGRFGFRSFKELVYDGVPQEYFLALAFGEKLARGRVAYHAAFTAPANS